MRPGRCLALLLGCWAGGAGAAPQVQWVDPTDAASVSTVPEEVLVMFTEPMAASANAQLHVCSKADAATGCAANCVARGVRTEDGFRLRRSGQLASWSMDGVPFKHGCRYDLRFDTGAFSTVQQPAQALSTYSWGFSLFLSAPKLQEGLLQTAGMTSLQVAVTWDDSVQFICRARPSPTDATPLPRETEPLSASRGTRALASLQGLIPGKSYTVECSAHRADMPALTSGWSSVGSFTTLEDTNAKLAGLRVRTAPVCTDGRQLPLEDQLLMPVFSADVLSYEVTVFLSDWRQHCGTGSGQWLVAAEPTKDSAYASVTATWSNSQQVGDARQLSLPASAATASISVAYEVNPHSSMAPRRSYFLVVSANSTGFGAGNGHPPTPAPIGAPTPTPMPTPAPTPLPASNTGGPTTTTAPAAATGSCPDVMAQLGATEFARTLCAASMQESQTCSLWCPQGQSSIGAYRCQSGLVVGSPTCSLSGAQTAVVTKLAGVLDLAMTSGASPSVDVTPQMRSSVQRSLAASLGLDAADVSKVSLVKLSGARLLSGANSGLRRRLSQLTWRLHYELLVRAGASAGSLMAGLNALGGAAVTAERTAFAQSLVQDGYTLSSASVVRSPISFQDTVMVTATPAPTTAPQPPSAGNVAQPGAGSPPEESGGMGIGMIIGIVVGALAFLSCLGFAAWYWRTHQGFANL